MALKLKPNFASISQTLPATKQDEQVKPVSLPFKPTENVMQPSAVNLGIKTSTPTGITPQVTSPTPIIPTKPKISANNLGTEGLNIAPPPEDTTDYNALVAGALESKPTTFKTPSGVEVDSKTGAVISQPEKEQTQDGKPPAESQNLYQKLVEQISGGTFGQAPERVDPTQFDEEYGIEQKQQLVNDLTAQLNAINAEAQAAQLSIEGQGRGITTSILGGQQARMERQRAIRALPISAALSAAQGNLDFAQGQITQALEIEKDYSDKVYQYNRDQRDAIYDIATTEEKRRIDAMNRADDIKREEDDRLYNLKADMVSQAIQNGQPELIQQIMGATSEDAVFSVGGQLRAPIDELEQLKIQQERIKLQQAETEAVGGTGAVLELAVGQQQIADINELIDNKYLDTAVGPNVLARISPFEKLTGGKKNFIADVEKMVSQLSLDSLISAKARGATFGALSDTEMAILSAAATTISKLAVKNKDGDVVGYGGSEGKFKEELDKINNFAKLDYVLKGGQPQDVGITTMEDGTMWTQNSDGSFTQIIRQ
jgi:hypothetical protein